MITWCEGKLKVRGRTENLKRFVLEGLEPCCKGENLKLQIDEDGDVYYNGTCHIKGIHRGFVEGIGANLSEDVDSDMIFFDARFPYGIDASELLEVCKEYNVDMRIFAYEQKREFNQHVEIVDGEITMDEFIEYDDYFWECPDPTIGG